MNLTTALAWEFWRRNQKAFVYILGTLLAFALFYRPLCALAGLDLQSDDVLGDVVQRAANFQGVTPTLAMVARLLYLLFLACGPSALMGLSLLWLVWIFTFNELSMRESDMFCFPARIFTLPISTSFLFWRLSLGGMASILALYFGWIMLVGPPLTSAIPAHSTVVPLLAFVTLAQGVTWTLRAWPNLRLLLLVGLVILLANALIWPLQQECPLMLTPAILLGMALGWIGLQKMRHGAWQGLIWERVMAFFRSRGKLRGPARFSSPAQAQIWLEWERSKRRFGYFGWSLALALVAIPLMVRYAFQLGPIDHNSLAFILVILLSIPVWGHFLLGVWEQKADLSFQMTRPKSTGEMTMSALSAAAITTVISWAIVAIACSGLPFLGDCQFIIAFVRDLPCAPLAFLAGAIILTWRLVAVNLISSATENPRLASIPKILVVTGSVAFIPLIVVATSDEYSRSILLRRVFPILLADALLLKFGLAIWGFRASLRRRLLSRAAAIGYGVVWAVIVTVWIAALVISPRGYDPILPWLIVLLVPLARVGLAPIAISSGRHA